MSEMIRCQICFKIMKAASGGKALEYGGNKINSHELGTWWVSF